LRQPVEEAHALDILTPYPSLLLAISGGPDSVALMLLIKKWSDRPKYSIAVATVDHGLREESSREAETVGQWAQELGFTHYHLNWLEEKPPTRLQERAREARYRLLETCAKEIGADAIVTAHHADDQAETILLRLTRGSGLTGLAGMADTRKLNKIKLLRPLLNFSKADLVKICHEAHHPYFNDPSNLNDKYTRGRLRKLMPTLAEEGLTSDALRRLGQRAQRVNVALDFYAKSARAQALIEQQDDKTLFSAVELECLPSEIVLRLLAQEITRLCPQFLLRLERLERLVSQLHDALLTSAPWQKTLAGCLIKINKGVVEIGRAPPRKSLSKTKSDS
jgi:tRNA(Ile)-lysidine synthase